MTCWLNFEINDEHGKNPLELPGNFEFAVEYDFKLGKFEDDVYPNVTLTNATCKNIYNGLLQRAPAPHEKTTLSQWFWAVLDKNPEIYDHITELAAEQMSFCVDS